MYNDFFILFLGDSIFHPPVQRGRAKRASIEVFSDGGLPYQYIFYDLYGARFARPRGTGGMGDVSPRGMKSSQN